MVVSVCAFFVSAPTLRVLTLPAAISPHSQAEYYHVTHSLWNLVSLPSVLFCSVSRGQWFSDSICGVECFCPGIHFRYCSWVIFVWIVWCVCIFCVENLNLRIENLSMLIFINLSVVILNYKYESVLFYWLNEMLLNFSKNLCNRQDLVFFSFSIWPLVFLNQIKYSIWTNIMNSFFFYKKNQSNIFLTFI